MSPSTPSSTTFFTLCLFLFIISGKRFMFMFVIFSKCWIYYFRADGITLYYISLVDGFNLPVKVVPGGGDCSATGCMADLSAACPTEFKVIKDGEAVACKNTCQTEPCMSSLFFNSACSGVHVYADDTYGFFTSSSSHYTVTFCPTSKRVDKKKDPSGKNVVEYISVFAVISVVCGFIIFRIKLRLSKRDCEIDLNAETRAGITIASNT